FLNVGKDMLEELAGFKGIKLRSKELDELGAILVRYTVGFGLVEVLLQDDKVQDITINSPMGRIPIFIVHADYTDCYTNIVPTTSEAESWASKLRMMSGRPLDEANPILDTELEIPGASARVNVVGPPLNPNGLAYSLRRHRDKPWTLQLLMKGRMINALGAGLMSFIIDGSRTMLVAGTRSAGKTSLLGSILVEIMRKYRMITIEDTLELPCVALRKLGYNIQPMKVASALTKGTTEISAEVGIRTTLRMGDSCLIVGEVRSDEAKALYEAMRVGALANVVAGTIHGDSPYGVYDWVVNDIGVPRTSFKATDIIIVANPIKSADGLHRWRRVTQISEVRKHWEEDPLLEKGFGDLMKYEAKTDQLEPTLDLINGDSDILKGIAGNVKEWASDWDAVWNNILLRAKIKQAHLDIVMKSGNIDLLEAPFVIQSNDQFHRISDQVRQEVGALDGKMIYEKWEEWLKIAIKKESLKPKEEKEVDTEY
ncbi:MAG: type II/IV secretion system ATPase subunit, partial [Nanoarchaeota archaeon]|nr:type II/IV secretion system ATPase subunit [Nanoarchaeota archaeon]